MQHYALLSIVYMIAFLLLFEKLHGRRRYGFGLVRLMPEDQLDQLFRIVAACQEP